MLAQDGTASRGCHCSADALITFSGEIHQVHQQQQTHAHVLSQQQDPQLQHTPAGQLAGQQARVPMRSPFLATQQYDVADGTLGSFAGQLLAELQRCVPNMHPAAGGQSQQANWHHHQQHKHHRHPHRHLLQSLQSPVLSVPLPACAASRLGFGGSEWMGQYCLKQYHSEELYSEESYSDSELEHAAEPMPAHHPAGNTAEVRALLENCLEEAAERARSQTVQSSGLYTLGSDSSLCSSGSVGDNPPTWDTAQRSMMSSGAVAIDWEAMLRSELSEAGMAKADLVALTAGDGLPHLRSLTAGAGASSLQCTTADWGVDRDEVQSAPQATAEQAAAMGGNHSS